MRKPSEGCARSRRRAWTRTFVGAGIAPIPIALYSLITTASWSSDELVIERWTTSSQTLAAEGSESFYPVGPEPVTLQYQRPADRGAFSEFTFDFFVRDPIPPRLHVFVRRTSTSSLGPALELSREIRSTGWNTDISVPFDHAEGFQGAEVIGVSVASPGGPTVIGIRNARLSSFSYAARLERMATRFLAPEPLTQRSINFNTSAKVGGRGTLYVFWMALVLATLALGARRIVLRERFPLVFHVSATVVVLCVLADVRNSVDYVDHLRTAIEKRQASGGNLVEYLALQEGTVFPWFAPVVDYLRRASSPEQPYFIQVPGGPGVAAAVARAAYYARPARRVDDPLEAQLVVVDEQEASRLAASEHWSEAARLSGGLVALEKRR